MRLGAIPENLLERVALGLGLVPTPLIDTQLAFTLARTVMIATRLGVFDALADGPLDAAEVAGRCHTHPQATRKLLNALVGVGYLRARGERYALTRTVRRWLLATARQSVRDKVLFAFEEWGFVEHYHHYLDSGRPLDMHDAMDTDAWHAYQRGMRALAVASADEVARRTPVPPGATRLLDIGGAHGHYAASLCRRHPGLEAVILDLPEAVSASAELLAAEGLGGRLRHQVGDALTTDLGREDWDVIFTSQVIHHLGESANRTLARRAANALRPAGVYVIQDLVRSDSGAQARRSRLGALLDLFFAATSRAGTYALVEMSAWQASAGLRPLPPIWLRSVPGTVQQVGKKPRQQG